MTVDSLIVEFHENPALTTIWRAQLEPCTNPYVPMYLGAAEVLEDYHFYDAPASGRTHFSPAAWEFQYDPRRAYWVFKTLVWLTEMDYSFCHAVFADPLRQLEAHWEAEQDTVRKAALLLDGAEHITQYLTEYSMQCEAEALAWARRMIQKIGEQKSLENAASSLDHVPGGATFRTDFFI